MHVVSAGAACGSTVACLAGGNNVAGTATATLDNVGAARDVFVIVDTSTTPASVGGTFSLSVTASSLTLPAGDVCGNVGAAIAASTVLQNETFTGFANQYIVASQVSCGYQGGINRVYAVNLPAGQSLTAIAVPVDGGVLPDGGLLNLSFSLLDAVADCNARSLASPTRPEVLHRPASSLAQTRAPRRRTCCSWSTRTRRLPRAPMRST